MNRKISFGVAIFLCLIVATVVFSMTMVFSTQIFNSRVGNLNIREEQFSKLSEIDRIVTLNYIGSDEIDKQKLIDSLSAGYTNGINDPYAQYYSAEAYSAQESTYQGQKVGIGISYRISSEGYPEIIEVYTDSPAQSVGLQVGDIITKINDIDTFSVVADGSKIASSDALAQLSGDSGTKVKITYRRTDPATGSFEEKEVEVTRRELEIPTVYHKMLSNGNGIIRITNFYDNTPKQFESALKDLQAQGATGIIFDVRDNTGGTMDSVVEILDMLVPEGDILRIEYADGSEVIKTSDAASIDLPMVVLTNSNTASSAEIFTQNLKDFGMAKTVGEKTYGKGVMQQFFKLNDGSAIRITNAKLYTNSGISVDGIGIAPDYPVNLSTIDKDALANVLWDNRNAQNDPQLAKSIEFLETQKNSVSTTSSDNVSSEIVSENIETENTDVVSTEEVIETPSE